MSLEYDFLIPLYRVCWNTRAVLEGITIRYQPQTIHLIAPQEQVQQLARLSMGWSVPQLQLYPEENFFDSPALTKAKICAELDLGKSLYTPGWFYQQLLKLGAFERIKSLSEWYMVWDSDLLPVASWPLVEQQDARLNHAFALLQHQDWGNGKIVAQWQDWIRQVLKVEPLKDIAGTFIPHHMWFKQEHLQSFARQVNNYYQSDEHWLKLMMRSANEFGTFSEYWAYASWVADRSTQDLYFYAYENFGATTERFFDDGSSIFTTTLKQHLPQLAQSEFYPSYEEIYAFILSAYGEDALPSSLSIENSPRHLQKKRQNMHIEELRSRWNPRLDSVGS
ncbi:MAG: DUF6492 family protein [Cyanobacteria bacterium J06623_7]